MDSRQNKKQLSLLLAPKTDSDHSALCHCYMVSKLRNCLFPVLETITSSFSLAPAIFYRICTFETTRCTAANDNFTNGQPAVADKWYLWLLCKAVLDREVNSKWSDPAVKPIMFDRMWSYDNIQLYCYILVYWVILIIRFNGFFSEEFSLEITSCFLVELSCRNIKYNLPKCLCTFKSISWTAWILQTYESWQFYENFVESC